MVARKGVFLQQSRSTRPIVEVAGAPVGDRGELRDYFDVLLIERNTGHRVEEGLAVVIERLVPADSAETVNGDVECCADLAHSLIAQASQSLRECSYRDTLDRVEIHG